MENEKDDIYLRFNSDQDSERLCNKINQSLN